MTPARQRPGHRHLAAHTPRQRRRLAQEAARLIAESGIDDYRQAKLKAARRLGIRNEAELPHNREIEAALREYQRLFLGVRQPRDLRRRREAALHALEFFACFQPRLVGPVLDGTADANSPIRLHLFSDDPNMVAVFLHEHAIPASSHSRQLRLDRHRSGEFDGWLFEAEGLNFELTVLPPELLRQAPLAAIDDKPMAQASAARLRELLRRETEKTLMTSD